MSEREVVTVAVGHFDPLVQGGLADALRKDHRVCVLASGLGEADLELVVVQQAPRVAILDETVAQSLLARVKSSQPATGVLVLVNNPTRLYETLLLAAGASWLARGASIVEVLAAVHLAAHGEPNSAVADSRPYPSGVHLLTPRELRVLQHLSRGESYGGIALAMEISGSTAKTHGDRIRRKLGVESKRELIGMAVPSPPVGETA